MNKILIANRGEIAVRIIRACKEMNIKTVAIYSEADKDALHTRLADEAICVGPAVTAKSYLNIRNILEALNITKADSIHPGFGFLAENSHFAKICEESNIKFIGPKSDVINLLGNKSNAKEMMKKAGIPVIPGSDGSVKNIEDAIKIAENIGYPVILKAAAGGGGKGIRIANDEEELKNSYVLVKHEAKNAFNDDEIYIEKFIQNPILTKLIQNNNTQSNYQTCPHFTKSLSNKTINILRIISQKHLHHKTSFNDTHKKQTKIKTFSFYEKTK